MINELNVERELKYIMSVDILSVIDKPEWLEKNGFELETALIFQNYMKDGCRIRKTVYDAGSYDEDTYYEFTTKYKAKDGRPLELEFDIKEETYTTLAEISECGIEKMRYILTDKSTGLHWEVDAFLFGHATHFMMEVEIDMNADEPMIPKGLEKYVVYSVPEKDTSKFSNYKLAKNPDLFKELLEEALDTPQPQAPATP